MTQLGLSYTPPFDARLDWERVLSTVRATVDRLGGEEHVRAFFAHWSDRCRGRIVLLTDSELSSTIRRVAEEAGRCSFAPVPCVMRGMSVRLQGDGPSSWSVYAMASRPRNAEMVKWGTLPGAYTGAPSREAGGGRGKPAWLMRALVGDYSRPGDLVVDPFAGQAAAIVAWRLADKELAR